MAAKAPRKRPVPAPSPARKPRAPSKEKKSAASRPSPKSSAPEVPASSSERPGEGRTLPFEIDPKRIEETLGRLGTELKRWANKGRYTKVRFKFRGKPLLPDLPLAAVVAAEGLTFYWAGILRALVFNLAGQRLLELELVSDAEAQVQKGREALLVGDLDRAIAELGRALEMDEGLPSAHLSLGVALKLKGERDAARESLVRALALDPEGPSGREAERVLEALG